jgi:hypothetical protein
MDAMTNLEGTLLHLLEYAVEVADGCYDDEHGGNVPGAKMDEIRAVLSAHGRDPYPLDTFRQRIMSGDRSAMKECAQ